MHLASCTCSTCFNGGDDTFHFWDLTKKRRLVKIGGKPKRWELRRS